MLRLAIKESKRSSVRCQHGATICSGKKVLARGHNSYRTHTTWGGGPLKTLHAEAAAIREAVNRGIDIRGSTIYVVRNNGNGGSQMSKPCRDCQTFIERFGISKVVYTDKNGDIVETWPL